MTVSLLAAKLLNHPAAQANSICSSLWVLMMVLYNIVTTMEVATSASVAPFIRTVATLACLVKGVGC